MLNGIQQSLGSSATNSLQSSPNNWEQVEPRRTAIISRPPSLPVQPPAVTPARLSRNTPHLLPLPMEDRLHRVAEEAFPNGVSDLLTACVGLVTMAGLKYLPFIPADRVVVTLSHRTTTGPSPSGCFEDTMPFGYGAETSCISSDSLDPAVRKNQSEGHAVMEITECQ